MSNQYGSRRAGRFPWGTFILGNTVIVLAVFAIWALVDRLWFVDASPEVVRRVQLTRFIVSSFGAAGFSAWLIHRKLRASEEAEAMVRAITENAGDAIVSADEHGRMITFNPAAERIFGYSAQDAIGQPLMLLMPERHREPHTSGLQRVVSGGAPRVIGRTVELEGRRKDGSEFPLELSLGSWKTSQGIFFTGVIRDISQRRLAESQERDSEERLQAILDNSPAIIALKDHEGRYVLINRRYAELFHVDRATVRGKSVHDVFPKEMADVYRANDERVLASGVATEFEEVAPHDDGVHTYLSVKFPLRYASGQPAGVCDIATDITDRKLIESELERQREELARSNRELEQFAYVASHDLQEPLRMVASYVELLERRYADQLDDDAREFIGFAVDGANRMSSLIRDLLTFSRVGTGAQGLGPVNVEVALDLAITNLRGMIDESGARVTRDPLPIVQGDPSQLAQVFLNLIGNALKFRGAEPPVVHVGAEPREGEWVLSVTDNGIGVAPEYGERIFTIFQRLHGRQEYTGTGIGLAICRKIVERHGGRIWMESSNGAGATFCFTLPRPEGASG